MNSLLSKYKSNLGVSFNGMHFSMAYFVSSRTVLTVPLFGFNRVILACEESSQICLCFLLSSRSLMDTDMI